MKKLFVILFALLVINIAQAQNYVTIPDANFVAYLKRIRPSLPMNGNQLDVNSAEVKIVRAINLKRQDIKDLTGIQYFTSLTNLDCSENSLTSLPDLPNTLTKLNCNWNKLTSLPELPTNLVELLCRNNQLTSLPELPQNLETIWCYINQLTSLPTLPSTLKYLDCCINQLTSLPELPDGLISLICNSNQLTKIPTLPNTLRGLICSSNDITSLPELPNSLSDLRIGSTKITSLPDLPNSMDLLYCTSNPLLTSLPKLPNELYELFCYNNALTSLPDLPSELHILRCNKNQLTSLPDLPNSLEQLHCDSNKISCFPSFPNSIVNSNCFNISGNPFTCLPNYIKQMDAATLAFPLCIVGDAINNKQNCSGFKGIMGSVFKDNNSNCIKDSTDLNLANAHVILYNSSGNMLSQTYSLASGFFSFPNLEGTYTVKIDTANMPFQAPCINHGADSTITLSLDHPLASNVNFSIGCKPGFDVGVQSVTHSGLVFPGEKHSVNILAGDMSNWAQLNCAAGISGQVQVTVKGPGSYYGTLAGALKPTVTGKVFTYTIPDFGAIDFKSAFGLVLYTDTTAQSDDLICLQVKVSPVAGDHNVGNNTYNYCYPAVNSFDPNMKEVFPVNVLPGYNDYFTYTIHFQNTGNANAINIRLVDVLSDYLDLSTFQVMNYSHPNTVSLYGNGLTVRFPNIQLPDSTRNPEGSNGFIQYRIKPKANLPVGTKINNTASIYFDYNAPIATNTTTNLYTTTVSVKENRINISSVSIYPNPTNGSITIESRSATPQEYSVSITNMQGQEVFSEKISLSGKHALDVSNLNDGVYFISLLNANERFKNKIVIQK